MKHVKRQFIPKRLVTKSSSRGPETIKACNNKNDIDKRWEIRSFEIKFTV